MNKLSAALALSALLASVTPAQSQPASHNFSFGPARIGGQGSGGALLTGGGAYDPLSHFLKAGGAFRCTEDIVGGPLAGCKEGEGVRWDAEEILSSSDFKCGTDPKKTIFTDDDTIVMKANFYRQGDGEEASFTANMFVSVGDENPDGIGTQNIWIQGVGCGETFGNFR